MSAVAVAPQALQGPVVESIKSPSVNRVRKSGRILHQARAHCPLGCELCETGGTSKTRCESIRSTSRVSRILVRHAPRFLALADFFGILL